MLVVVVVDVGPAWTWASPVDPKCLRVTLAKKRTNMDGFRPINKKSSKYFSCSLGSSKVVPRCTMS